MNDTEVIIAGGGIAGLTLSLLLEKKGIDHVVISRKGKANSFALAETLPPSALPLLGKLGLLELFESTAIQKTYGYHSLWGSNAVTDHNFYFHNPFKHGLKINKAAIISHLEHQQKRHIKYYEKSFAVVSDINGVTTAFDDGALTKSIKAKLIVDATGRNRAVLGHLNIPATNYDALMAFSCHVPRVKHSALTHNVYIETFEEGWGIVSALSETENVMTLFTTKKNPVQPQLKDYENWATLLSGTTYLKDFLTESKDIKVKGSKANSSKAVALAGDNWLAVGDAAISFDPLSSHGITNALYTAHLAATTIEKHIKQGDHTALKAYDKLLAAIFEQYLQTKGQLYNNEKRWPVSSFWNDKNSAG